MQNSPVDVFVTIYDDGHPKYVTYKDIVPPTTIDIDASTDGIVADHTFVLSAPPNKTLSVTIDAFEDNEASVGLTTQFLSTTGETSLTVGYKEGYPKYRTTVHYQSGKKHATYVTTGSAVPETHTFPSFDFTFENIAANDFKAGSSVPFDAAVLSYLGNPLGTVWTVVLPGSDSPAINFKAKDFPKEIRDAHPDLPPVEQVRFSGLSAFQFSEDSYADVIEAASENGHPLSTLETDNYTLFGQGAD